MMARRVVKALLTAAWFMLLTLPVMGMRLNIVENSLQWRLDRVFALGGAIFFLALAWNWAFERKARGLPLFSLPPRLVALGAGLAASEGARRGALGSLALALLAAPLFCSFYQTNSLI